MDDDFCESLPSLLSPTVDPTDPVFPLARTDAEAIAAAYRPAHTGRPSVITEIPRLTCLLVHLYHGVHVSPAANLAGFDDAQLSRWQQRAKADEEAGITLSPFRRLAAAMKRARAYAEAEATGAIQGAWRAGPQYWAAAATYLERSYPTRWGRRQDEDSGPKVVVQIGTPTASINLGIAVQIGTQQPESFPIVSKNETPALVSQNETQVIDLGAKPVRRGSRGGVIGRPRKDKHA